MMGEYLFKTPISYYGGKQRMAGKIIPLIPQHTVYAEPFVGGGGIFFAKPWPVTTQQSDYREAINDVDGRLINFYQQLRDNGPLLVEKLQLTPYSELEHRISKDLLIDDPLEAARRYYVQSQQSFANKLYGGWGRGVFSGDRAALWCNKVHRLDSYLERMAAVNISCTDAFTFIRQWDSPQTFFYCDPPYPGTNQGSYIQGFNEDDFARLIEVLNQCQGSFICSCYDVPGVSIPDDWEKFEFRSICSASGKGRTRQDRSKNRTKEEMGNTERVEVVYRRFNTVLPRDEILDLYDSGRFDCFVKHPNLDRLMNEPTRRNRFVSKVTELRPQQLDLFSL